MILIRSLAFFCLFVLTTVFYGLPLSILGWLTPMSWRHATANAWGRTSIWFLERVCGLTYMIEGMEHIPDGPAIIMAKHQSTWETLALRGLLRKEQAWVLKRELMRVPVFGWAMATLNPIAIDRKAGSKAAKQVIAQGKACLEEGRIVIIFPEGTRTAPGEKRKYGIGGGLLAEKSGYPVIPVAHNAGVFWRRHGLRKYPGTIQVVVGKPILSGGKKASEITREVEAWIEETQERLPVKQEQAG